jgi:flagellar hook-basal body complex protein FliE
MSVSTIGTIGRIDTTLPKASPTGGVDGVSFADSLGKALESVEEKNQEANVAVTGMLNKTVDVHEAMIALHEAEESLEITVAVRNKFVQAYQEIMRMGL